MIALLVMAAALYLQISTANRSVHRIQQAGNLITQLTVTNRLLLDEESSLRGFQVTGDSRFLDPYKQAQLPLEQQLSSLQSVPGLEPEQIAEIQALKHLHGAWNESFVAPVLSGNAGATSFDTVELAVHGKQLMDAMRQNLERLIVQEEEARSARITLWREENKQILAALFVLAVSFGMGIGIFTRHRLHEVSSAYRNSVHEAELRAATLFDSEQELRTTLASIGDAVIACDALGRISMMNPVAEDLTGWTIEHAKGLPLHQVFSIVNETTRAPVEDPIAKVKRLNRVVGFSNHTLLIRRDGSELPIANSGSPVRGQLGDIAGIVLVFRDVTLEKKTQATLLANEKFVVAGRLAATIAHEIHNPLDSVANLLYLIRTGSSEQEARHFMAMAEQELARVTQISRAMLGLYRESRAPVELDLSEIVKDVLLLLERRLADLQVTHESSLPPKVCVAAFPAELRQVFTNLITNAAEASSPGGHIRIRISPKPSTLEPDGKRSEPGAIVSISDDGPGISPEIQAQLFQPFFTTKGEQGTGLGLWVSRGIITKHGGSIDISSSTAEPTHGTTITVFLATKPTLAIGPA